MKYRLDKYGNKVSALGYGCMRFTNKGMKPDYDKTSKELMCAYNNGVNYYDTAYLYPGSEELLGRFLEENNLRDKVYIATKLPHYMVKTKEDIEKFFQEELRRLRTDHIDYYLMHMLTDIASWNRLVDLGIIDWIKAKKESGAIRQIGFSYHGNSDMFCKIIDSYDWDICLIQYNYLDEFSQAGVTGLKYAASKGIPVNIMEPLRGGSLITNIPDEVQALWDTADKKRSPVEWAFEYLWDKPLVTSVFSGMSNMDQVKQNIAIAENCDVNSMSEHDRQILKDVTQVYKSREEIPCTGCRYCMPCHNRVDIPHCFKQYNIAKSLDYIDKTAAPYFWLVNKDERADSCTFCGECNIQCPQGIDIPAEMEKVFDFFHDEEFM
jgi:predicted aldo/keto reductase-like oxidoreductase